MAKYTAPISEKLRQRILGLPRGVKFGDFMEKAMLVFVEELEKNPDLRPENFSIAMIELKDGAKKKG